MSVIRRLLRNSFLLLALLGVVSGMPGGMLAATAAAPAGQTQSAAQTKQTSDCIACRHASANRCAPDQGGAHMGGASCMGAASCSMLAAPSAVVATIFPQLGVRPVGPDRNGGRRLSGPDTRPPIARF